MAKNFKTKKRPPPPEAILEDIRKDARDALRNVGREGVKRYSAVVANWSEKTQPKFRFRTSDLNEALLTLEVTSKMPSEKKKPVWKWVNKTGTKPHTIAPKKNNPSQRLFFQWGGPGSYKAKTKANPARFGGPGTVSNAKLTIAKQVQHPGFEARNFNEDINADLNKLLEKELAASILRSLRLAKRRGKRREG